MGDEGIPTGDHTVTLSGTVAGQQFERIAQLQVRPTIAEYGVTNEVAQIDMTYVSVSGNTVTVEPDERVAATGMNNFVDSGDFIRACLYYRSPAA